MRTCTAAVEYRQAGRYVATLSGSTFLTGPICTALGGDAAGLGCHQFLASGDIDTVHLFLENHNDDAHGAHIVEQLSSGGWIEVSGRAVGPWDGSHAVTSGPGSVWYCPTSSGYPFPCPTLTSCGADLRFTLRRQ